ncbi:MAG: transcription-repair coupling factor [Ignavibacteriae bacterium]|nr:transcription-repair coupling factor [Ignavibacteriota bacterium]
MIRQLKQKIFRSEPLQLLSEQLKGITNNVPIHLSGVSGSLLAFVAASVFEQCRSQLVVIVTDEEKAERVRDDCALLLGEDAVRLAVYDGSHHSEALDVSTSIAMVETLRALGEGKPCLVVASAEGIASSVPQPELFKRQSMQVRAGSEQPFEPFLAKLVELGFERKEFVEGYGDFAVRGGIVDVFPFIGDNPVRVEFWGDSVESIREFDALSQRSIRRLEAAHILPGFWVPGFGSSAQGGHAETPHVSLFDYLKNDAILLLDEPALLQKEVDEFHKFGGERSSWEEVGSAVNRFARVVHSSFEFTDAIRFSSTAQASLNGNIKLAVQRIRDLNEMKYEVLIACDTQEEERRLKELFDEEQTAPNEELQNDEARRSNFELRYTLFTDAVHAGFTYPAANIVVLTEHEIFGRLKRQAIAKRTRFKGITQKELSQLRRGDFVVHVDYGVGKFSGLEKIKVRGAEQEVMKVLYLDGDALYVNLNYVNRVQKYSSREGHVPTLTKLGAPQWDRLKEKAKKRVKDIARKLIALYARRKMELGFAFAPDTHWQKEMEASFMYEDTPDQAQATLQVKQDMEQPSPMDRLVCGDVGFGKTEVAVRAAFKAVLSGKQVGVLVPTTILAQQHYNTFLDRLGRYSVKIEALHRFRAKKEQTSVLEHLKDGKVDVIIGTHRLLSKDVQFKDIGLLVIDEEQRFGVSAKEKLRQMRANVDTLTLTATPIPRTLHFSLMGARDLSLINTPPRNRRPIQTEIAQFEMKLIREAILREMRRGGQVYFVHDRIQSIEDIQRMLEEHVPEARFHVAHGQMKGHELEATMMAFLEKKYDVLICTKIIESGIDIPSVNTIIINRADRFGLAELYQLRGRVGRSNEQAYAYLLTPPLSVLPRPTLRRLQALQEFTELGSGFNLAMRDLEIRGAGNLLGAEQSGFIIEMGFELYQKIVEEAVAELKEKEFSEVFTEQKTDGKPSKAETIIETDIEAFIPDFYIESDAERLDIYRRLYKIETDAEIQSMRDEMRDRFGEYPEEVENMFATVELKILARQLGCTKVDLRGNLLVLDFPSTEEEWFYGKDGEDSSFQSIMAKTQSLKSYKPQLKQDNKRLRLHATLERDTETAKVISSAKAFLQGLLK